MTEVERVAAKMKAVGDYWPPGVGDRLGSVNLKAIARWHLRELRRARGRTVGYVGVHRGPIGVPRLTETFWTVRAMTEAETHGMADTRVARVVLVQKRRSK